MDKIVAILPFSSPENASLPSNLNGHEGSNRAVGKPAQITASNDLQAIQAWLACFADTKTTFNNYRKEAERLYLWAVFQLGKPVSSLTHEDLLVYKRFIQDPQPRNKWVSEGGRKYARNHTLWRPFYSALSPASQRQAMVILNAMFAWLVNAGYLAGNPLSLSRQRAKKAKPRITRYLDPLLWQEVKNYIEAMPKGSIREQSHYFRSRWLFTILYLGGLRISEVSNNTMGCFFFRRDKEGQEFWWLEILGKGDKLRLVPATNEMITELVQYRRSLELPLYPSTNEETPLVLSIGKSMKPLTRSALHMIIKKVFKETAAGLRLRGDEYMARADLVEQASAHWLRHTAGSHMADQEIDIRLIRDNLGHESLNTTSQYLHADDDKRHSETDQNHRIDW
ncbi:MAG: tyrosine-type recombinase/integrase [Methyloprofundus sp.]|nr:tyrosine-type recombinase/integrase [Methyloprofundus sp.]